MVGRLTIAAIGATGVVLVGLGVASATAWRADSVLRSTVTADAPYVVTAPGVVEMGGSPTTVTAYTSDTSAPLVIVVGRDSDVTGWVGDDPHALVTGLSGWHRLAVDTAAPTASPRPTPEAEDVDAVETTDEAEAVSEPGLADPTGSDMWIEQVSGTGRVTLTWSSDDPGRWSVLVASPSGAPPTLELAWPREVSTPWLIPGTLVGGLLIVVALGLLARPWLARRSGGDGWTSVETGPVATLGGAPSRVRQGLRQVARATSAASIRSGPTRTADEASSRDAAEPGPSAPVEVPATAAPAGRREPAARTGPTATVEPPAAAASAAPPTGPTPSTSPVAPTRPSVPTEPAVTAPASRLWPARRGGTSASQATPATGAEPTAPVASAAEAESRRPAFRLQKALPSWSSSRPGQHAQPTAPTLDGVAGERLSSGAPGLSATPSASSASAPVLPTGAGTPTWARSAPQSPPASQQAPVSAQSSASTQPPASAPAPPTRSSQRSALRPPAPAVPPASPSSATAVPTSPGPASRPGPPPAVSSGRATRPVDRPVPSGQVPVAPPPAPPSGPTQVVPSGPRPRLSSRFVARSAPAAAPAEAPAPPASGGGWVPGRGPRSEPVPRVPADRPDGSRGRPTWLGRGRPAPAPGTGATPTVLPESTASRLSVPAPAPAEPAPQTPASRGDQWRRIWGIDDPHEDGRDS